MITTSISNIQSSLTSLQEDLPAFRQHLKENYTESTNKKQWASEL